MNNQDAVPMTREGKHKLERELEELTTVKRKEIAGRLKEAISHGDLRENAGYEEAKHAQALLEIRIKEITENLANSILIEDTPVNTGVVALGRQVVIQEEGTELEETYIIVGTTETDPGLGRISNESPMGQALLDKKVGDKVGIQTPAGEISFRIVRVEGV